MNESINNIIRHLLAEYEINVLTIESLKRWPLNREFELRRMHLEDLNERILDRVDELS